MTATHDIVRDLRGSRGWMGCSSLPPQSDWKPPISPWLLAGGMLPLRLLLIEAKAAKGTGTWVVQLGIMVGREQPVSFLPLLKSFPLPGIPSSLGDGNFRERLLQALPHGS